MAEGKFGVRPSPISSKKAIKSPTNPSNVGVGGPKKGHTGK